MQIIEQIARALDDVRSKTPLLHHITNYVTVNDCANIALAIGASPVMADDPREVADIAGIASALVLNIGTLNARTIEAMLAAGKAANARGVPVVLDPVGVGASRLRGDATHSLLRAVRASVLRGNISEIRWVAGDAAAARGVDAASGDALENASARKVAARVAAQYGCTVAITGAVDVVSDGDHTLSLCAGHPLLARVSGTGCMCNTLIAAFLGAGASPLAAALGGILCMNIAGERAAQSARGLGSFRAALMDEICALTPDILRRREVCL